MKYTLFRTKSGFTLVELLIVLAIVGILSAVAMASLNLSRAAARDTRRASDLLEIQLGLALYYDVNKSYPATLSVLIDPQQKYLPLPAIPSDPLNATAYEYLVTSGKYCLGVKFEGNIPSSLPPSATCTSKASGSIANYKAQR